MCIKVNTMYLIKVWANLVSLVEYIYSHCYVAVLVSTLVINSGACTQCSLVNHTLLLPQRWMYCITSTRVWELWALRHVTCRNVGRANGIAVVT